MEEGARIIVAGGTGDLGRRIVRELRSRGARVRAIVRPTSRHASIEELRRLGAEIAVAGFDDLEGLRSACADGACVVSALSGVGDVIVDAQTALLNASVAAGVPRFIPSDFCVDYMRPRTTDNRNLDLRRTFRARLDAAPIAGTSIMNGMFAELLNGPAPVILRRFKRVLYWENADQPLDFTTRADTAAYTAEAALDPTAPPDLRIAGDVLTARDLVAAASAVTGAEFALLRGGGTGRLDTIIGVTRLLMPGREKPFPPWQGMQYLRDMFSGETKLPSLDNDRYPVRPWRSVRSVLQSGDYGTGGDS